MASLLSPPQRQVLRLLDDGWTCATCARTPGPFGKLVFYGFHLGAETRWASGTTLASLERRGWIAWQATTLTFAYDGSQMPGHALILTPAGAALAASQKENERYATTCPQL